ncbi:DUF4276 family protein [Spirosoma endophyticum]|uniref:DUF4276 family protein n=1 Tax=Spirosoma endophyticum TaxID=662367 RepID=A0A1I1FQW9_9BACT|nr:DUF4276 family protein [Spirosoma endophyticum]SFB99483.1 protein of unknown function [Spirosoma endophyticum]
MIRLNVTAEGHAEEQFVNQILRPHLLPLGIYADVRRLRTSKGHRGGYTSFGKAEFDIRQWLSEDPTAWHTTLIDLYGLDNQFPAFDETRLLRPYDRVAQLEQALEERINHYRFIPYLQLHEFEALLFADPAHTESWLQLDHPELPTGSLAAIRQTYQTPEEINDSPHTAPSKRILSLCSGYNKIADGILILKDVTLAVLRNECPHFDEWITRLEDLAKL